MEITAKLFRNGRSQAVRIPKAFRFEGVDQVIMRKEGEALGGHGFGVVRRQAETPGPTVPG